MLKQRLITALILIPPVVWAVLALPSGVFAVLFSLPVLVGAWEWAALSDVPGRTGRVAYVAVTGSVLAGCWYTIDDPTVLLGIMALTALWWVYVSFRLARVRGEDVAPQPASLTRSLRVASLGVVVLAPAWTALVALHASEAYGPRFVLFFFVLVWGADIGAYFAGRRLGKRKLAPHISPGKSWEGVWGGLLVVVGVAGAGGTLFGVPAAQMAVWVGLGLVTAVFSISGDLLVSFFKRQKGVKDSGHLLPGHGGILDRIDSMTAAAPVFVFGLLILGLQL